MISFKREGNVLMINFESGTSEKPTLTFKRECASALEAELLYHKLDSRLDNVIEAARRHEYNSGWSDKAKRKEKRDYFYNNLLKTAYEQ